MVRLTWAAVSAMRDLIEVCFVERGWWLRANMCYKYVMAHACSQASGEEAHLVQATQVAHATSLSQSTL